MLSLVDAKEGLGFDKIAFQGDYRVFFMLPSKLLSFRYNLERFLWRKVGMVPK